MHIYKFSFILLTKSQSVVTKLLNPLDRMKTICLNSLRARVKFTNTFEDKDVIENNFYFNIPQHFF